MWFGRYHADDELIKNRYGIPEPNMKHADLRPAHLLDLVFIPLVAFDTQCNRLGMGGGYYDRTFEFIRKRPEHRKPILVGLAYEFQRQQALKPEPWDVPLDMIVTETGIYKRASQ